ncbi:hypothetical protein AAFP30_24180 [Gordonia sp. CPCC 205515]|uniref:hypothetical protein n=1 Tax=Gordonia sp. CPCC 205515 TaxID=3140791 RepID=UPI003AF33D04
MPRPSMVTASDLRSFMMATYFALRLMIAAGALLLPVVLVIWAAVSDDVDLQGSISGFYYTDARDVFVGIVVAVGVALIAYRGYSVGENWLLNLAGVLAIVVALVPTTPPGDGGMNLVHTAAAIGFFLVIALSIVLYGRLTLSLLDPAEAQRFSVAYWILTALLVVLPILAAVIAHRTGPSTALFWIETAALIAFVAFWVTKTAELWRSDADQRICAGTVACDATGQLQATDAGRS